MTKRSPALRLLALLLAALLLAGCGAAGNAAESEPQRYSVVYYDVFDTVTTIIGYCDSEAEFNEQAEAIHEDLLRYNRLFDIYNDYDGVNNLKTVNDNAGVQPVAVDSEIIDMLETALDAYTLTGGKNNIALGSVLKLWHDAREAAVDGEGTPPAEMQLQEAAQHCDIANLVIDREAGTVYLTDPQLRLDVGSCGKGYACEQAAQAAEARGFTCGMLNLGGNVRAIGTKPGAENNYWTGAVTDPRGSDGDYIAAVYLHDGYSLVTSGDYQRYFECDGVRYHHLIDPDTLYPAQLFSSVTVLTTDSGLADCLSTGLFCMSLEDGMELAESLDDVEVLWCLADGEAIYKTSGWDAFAADI